MGRYGRRGNYSDPSKARTHKDRISEAMRVVMYKYIYVMYKSCPLGDPIDDAEQVGVKVWDVFCKGKPSFIELQELLNAQDPVLMRSVATRSSFRSHKEIKGTQQDLINVCIPTYQRAKQTVTQGVITTTQDRSEGIMRMLYCPLPMLNTNPQIREIIQTEELAYCIGGSFDHSEYGEENNKGYRWRHGEIPTPGSSLWVTMANPYHDMLVEWAKIMNMTIDKARWARLAIENIVDNCSTTGQLVRIFPAVSGLLPSEGATWMAARKAASPLPVEITSLSVEQQNALSKIVAELSNLVTRAVLMKDPGHDIYARILQHCTPDPAYTTEQFDPNSIERWDGV